VQDARTFISLTGPVRAGRPHLGFGIRPSFKTLVIRSFRVKLASDSAV
jgi:hypothetical protein